MAEKLNAELLGKQLWAEVHDEIEEHEDNYDEDGNLRYSEQQFVEMFQEVQDIIDGKIPRKSWDEFLAELEAEDEEEHLRENENYTHAAV